MSSCRSQRGNNNAYCQDNPINWFDWTTIMERNGGDFRFLLKRRSRLRGAFRCCSIASFCSARTLTTINVADLTWFAPDLGRTPMAGMSNTRTLCSPTRRQRGRTLSRRRSSVLYSQRPSRVRNGLSCRCWMPGALGTERLIRAYAAKRAFTDAGGKSCVDPPDHYIANARSTVVLLARAPV